MLPEEGKGNLFSELHCAEQH